MKYYLKKFAIEYLIIYLSLVAIFVLPELLFDINIDIPPIVTTTVYISTLIYYDIFLIQTYCKRESSPEIPHWRLTFVFYTTLVASLYQIITALSFLSFIKYNLIQMHLFESSLTEASDIAIVESMKRQTFTEVPFLQIIDNHFAILISVVILGTLALIFLTQLFSLRKAKFKKLLNIES